MIKVPLLEKENGKETKIGWDNPDYVAKGLMEISMNLTNLGFVMTMHPNIFSEKDKKDLDIANSTLLLIGKRYKEYKKG